MMSGSKNKKPTAAEELVNEPCVDCGRNVEAPRKWFARKSEQGIPVLCKTCLEDEQARQRRQLGPT